MIPAAILIVMTMGWNGTHSITMQEFSAASTCYSAAKVIKDTAMSSNTSIGIKTITAFCVDK